LAVGAAGHVAPHVPERVTDHEIAKINAQLDELAVKAPNPLLGAFSDDDSDAELDEDTELTQSLREFTVADDGKKIDMRSTRSRPAVVLRSGGAALTVFRWPPLRRTVAQVCPGRRRWRRARCRTWPRPRRAATRAATVRTRRLPLRWQRRSRARELTADLV